MSTSMTVAAGVGAVALGALIYWMVTAKTQAQALGDSLENKIGSASNVSALMQVATAVGQIDAATIKAADHASDIAKVTNGWKGAAGAVADARLQYQQLSGYQQKMVGQFSSITSGADKISRAYGTTSRSPWPWRTRPG